MSFLCPGNPKWLVPLIHNNRNCHLITKSWSIYYLIIGKYGDSSEFFAPLWKYATMADAYVEEIHFRETSQLLTKREISAITGMIFLRILIQISVWKTLRHLRKNNFLF